MSTGPIVNSYWVSPHTFAAGEYPGAKDERSARTKLRRLLNAGIRTFVDLTEANGLAPYDGWLQSEAQALGLEDVRWLRLPIRDLSVPSQERMLAIQSTIAESLGAGLPVYVHCWGGVGRTGTVVACRLVEEGQQGSEALATLDALWQFMEKRNRIPKSPETPEQESFVLDWRPALAASSGECSLPSGGDRRFRGCLLGGAVGDALGAAVEFSNLAEIRNRFGPAGLEDYAPAYGREGAITDDTQMTMWTVEGLLRGHCRGTLRGILHMPSIVHFAYLRWLKTQGRTSPESCFAKANSEQPAGWLIGVEALHSRRAPGSTCLTALIHSNGPGPARNDSKGCGGVMRVAPVGLYEQDPQHAFDLASDVAAITHGHPTGRLAAGCLAAIIAEVRQGADLRDALDSSMTILASHRHHEETTDCLNVALRLLDNGADLTPETIEQIGAGWIAEEALAISIFCALAFPQDFKRAVLLAVNHGGDSDSTGAITGNILGAHLGIEAIPKDLLQRLELRKEITALADDLHTLYRDDDNWWARYPGY